MANGKSANAKSQPTATERALATSLRKPYRELAQFQARVKVSLPRYAAGPDQAKLIFAWGKGARWYYEVQDGWHKPMRGSTLHLWRWGSKQMIVVDVIDRRVRRVAWDTSTEAQALAFLFEDFAERYALTRADADPRSGAGVLVTARARRPATGMFAELRLLVPAGEERVYHIGLEKLVAERMPREFGFQFNFSDVRPLEELSLPESCFVLGTSDGADAASACPSD